MSDIVADLRDLADECDDYDGDLPLAVAATLLGAAAAIERLSRPTCRWVFDEDGPYETGCGRAWQFIEDGVKENGVRFCPFCGGEIIEAGGEA